MAMCCSAKCWEFLVRLSTKKYKDVKLLKAIICLFFCARTNLPYTVTVTRQEMAYLEARTVL
jgi:hypothetical protein